MTGRGFDAEMLASELGRALAGAGGVPAEDVGSISVLIDVGEWQVGLATLFTQTYEHDLVVDDDQRALLAGFGTLLRVPVGSLLGDPRSTAPGAP